MQRFVCHILVALVCYFSASVGASAQTKIYVNNNTDVELRVIDVSTYGDKISKKAWKTGVTSVAPGEREPILSLNRTGKINWMDPTPRFVEPDQTVTFHSKIVTANSPADKPAILLQKLYGEGKTTKLWYAIDGVNEPVIWEPQNKEYIKQWIIPGNVIIIVFKAFKDGKKTHVEYTFSYQ